METIDKTEKPFRLTVRLDKQLYKVIRIKLLAEDSNFTEWLNRAMLDKVMEGEKSV